ncbi:hypothetical protein ANCCAN_27433 [Ancylostoma caninum]|uniref:Uncharacterized protein n=1 Tax=Ancylostoma caninum TaxID=29170 RepID=A0A368F715_ANCCA|nr:hypothetical protein ANCCAN_27433 [Ancylostoma caninum]
MTIRSALSPTKVSSTAAIVEIHMPRATIREIARIFYCLKVHMLIRKISIFSPGVFMRPVAS